MNLYEAMFILNAVEYSKDGEGLQGRVNEMITRHGGVIRKAEKWAERRLAYEINGQSKGVYYLVFFDGPSECVDKIRADQRLKKDTIMRILILRHEDDSVLGKPTFSDAEHAAAEKAKRMMRDAGRETKPEKEGVQPGSDGKPGDAEKKAGDAPEAGKKPDGPAETVETAKKEEN